MDCHIFASKILADPDGDFREAFLRHRISGVLFAIKWEENRRCALSDPSHRISWIRQLKIIFSPVYFTGDTDLLRLPVSARRERESRICLIVPGCEHPRHQYRHHDHRQLRQRHSHPPHPRLIPSLIWTHLRYILPDILCI